MLMLHPGTLRTYVFQNDLPFAPPVEGGTRWFDNDQILGLMLFQQLISDGWSRQRASSIATAVHSFAHSNPNATIAAVIRVLGQDRAVTLDEWADGGNPQEAFVIDISSRRGAIEKVLAA
jgi:hypothetical protein